MRVRFTLALTPALSPGERENRPLVSGEFAPALVRVGLWGEDRKAREGKVDHRICENTLRMISLTMNPPLERDRSPVAASPKACSCRNPSQAADCIRTRCAPGRRALRTPAGSGAQGAIKVRGVLSSVLSPLLRRGERRKKNALRKIVAGRDDSFL